MHNSPIVNSFLLHGLSFIFPFCPDLLHQLQEGVFKFVVAAMKAGRNKSWKQPRCRLD